MDACVSSFNPLQLTQEQLEESMRLMTIINESNDEVRVRYRDEIIDHATTKHVYRWSYKPYELAFEEGFTAPAKSHPEQRNYIYYSIYDHVFHGGRPLDPDPDPNIRKHGFVSTTTCPKWHPKPKFKDTDVIEAYRYEIFAPGGIDVEHTLNKKYGKYKNQKEISFVKGIAPEYIRAAQKWTFTRRRKKRTSKELEELEECGDLEETEESGEFMHPEARRSDDILYVNRKFRDYEEKAGLRIKDKLDHGYTKGKKIPLVERLV